MHIGLNMVNMFRKSIFGFLILTMVLMSGCLNSNESIQKTQPTITPASVPIKENKIINLHAKQIILDDSEIEDLFGVILAKNENSIQETDELPVYYSPYYDIHSVHILSGANNFYVLKKPDNNKYNVSIGVYVFPTVDNAKYFESRIIDSDQNIKVIKNKIGIGNTTQDLYSVVSIKPLFSWDGSCNLVLNYSFILSFYKQNYGQHTSPSYSCIETNHGKSINIEYYVYNEESSLFTWDEVPGKDNEKFINFLKNEYKIDWIETAKIEKSNDNKTIYASNRENFLTLNLYKPGCLTCPGAQLEINDKYQDSFNVITFAQGKRYIYKIVRNSFSLTLNDEKTKVNLKTYDGRFNDEFDVKIEETTLNILGETYHNTLNIYKQSKLLTDLNVGDSVIMFSKNNIMVIIRSNPDVKIETLLELAKKQDAKISRILDMIK